MQSIAVENACMTINEVARLDLRILPNRRALGEVAARDIAAELRATLAKRDSARMIFAAAPSQAETLAALATIEGIDWSRVTAFHMDEYLGLPSNAPQRFVTWLRSAFFSRVPLGAVHYIDPDKSPEDSVASYAAALAQAPIDAVCMGIGINGHIAFNDPGVADLHDPEAVRVVDLDERSRVQQVEDRLFATVADVPRRAITLTVPTLMSARRVFCMVPGSLKAQALEATVNAPISTTWPSTMLRTHPNCTIYADVDAASKINPAVLRGHSG